MMMMMMILVMIVRLMIVVVARMMMMMMMMMKMILGLVMLMISMISIYSRKVPSVFVKNLTLDLLVMIIMKIKHSKRGSFTLLSFIPSWLEISCMNKVCH